MMARSCREFAIAGTTKLTAQRLLADREPELVPDPLHQVDQSPPHYAMGCRDWSSFDNTQQRMPLLSAEQWQSTRHLAVDQTVRATHVEPHHSVVHDLKTDTADVGRLALAATVIDRRQRK